MQNDALVLKTVGLEKYTAQVKMPIGNLQELGNNNWLKKKKAWEDWGGGGPSGRISKCQSPEKGTNK